MLAVATVTLALVIKGCWWKATLAFTNPSEAQLHKGKHSVSRALGAPYGGCGACPGNLVLEEYLHLLVRGELQGRDRGFSDHWTLRNPEPLVSAGEVIPSLPHSFPYFLWLLRTFFQDGNKVALRRDMWVHCLKPT